MNPGFWRGKRVLLTGHTGFKGAWLSLWLERCGASVTGFALAPPTSPSLFDLAGVAAGLAHVEGDVRDLGALRAAVARAEPDVAIHMAAQSLVRLSYEQPSETYATNVQGTANFLEALRTAAGARVAIVVTSDKCYRSRPDADGYREGDPLGGHDPYSNSKACAELVTGCYRDAFFSTPGGLALASVRAGNVVGGGDWAKDRLVPDILKALAQGRAPEIRYPDAVRPWQHVLEPLGGYLLLAEKLWQDPSLAGPWNFGPSRDDEKPVRWIVERLQAGLAAPAPWKPQPGQHPKEAEALRLDSGKARAGLGWKPRWALGRALDAIMEWQRGYLA
ncbi:MAG TPA: CDP-glucose 4,6-dehydratase, partial [bacterium]|nr:CDP-glucose 4,6-dehydratase [bacterium]